MFIERLIELSAYCVLIQDNYELKAVLTKVRADLTLYAEQLSG